MSNIIREILNKQEIVIIDGGLGTELEARNLDLKGDLWSAKALYEHPDIIRQIHYNYFKAGADIGISASYQASIEGFVQAGYSREESQQLIRRSVELVREARDKLWNELSKKEKEGRLYPVIAGSVGPYAASFADGSEYVGYDSSITKEEFIRYHSPRIRLLLEAGAEILAVETIPSLLEAEAIMEILKQYPDVYAWVSFSSRSAGNISCGIPIEDCVRALEAYNQIAAIGVNCVVPELVSGLLEKIVSNTKKPVIIYPDGNETFEFDKASPLRELDFAARAEVWHRQGASVIGGCCGITPADIQQLAGRMRA